MSERYRHLVIQRLERVNPRRRRNAPPVERPADPRAHADRLVHEVERAVEMPVSAAFDDRRLLKLRVEGIDPEDLEVIDGLQVVSQEGKKLIVLFATEEGLGEFRRRLAAIGAGERVTRQEILFAVKGVEGWSQDDRIGFALQREGRPAKERFIVDVELWALDRAPDRQQMMRAFEGWCAGQGAHIIDSVKQEAVILYRLRLTGPTLDALLLHRDVRLVDLPPRYQLDLRLVHVPLRVLPHVPPPPDGAPGVVILDSGLVSNHPLLGPAVGDAQSFIHGASSQDENGHGTAVAGLALYGDLWDCTERQEFIPRLRLFSGRVLTSDGEYDHRFIENQVIEAVKYFMENYGCRIFNLSIGDKRKPYNGGHVRGLAAVLDTLARQYGILFVVSAGNFEGFGDFPADWRRQYPDYLFCDEARIIDPATAVNVLTVGSLARADVGRSGQRFPLDPAYQPVSRPGQPSPFTRTGPGPRGAIKPEVVAYGGNYHIDARGGTVSEAGLGELTTRRDHHKNLFTVVSGTSYAAPQIAHLAGLLLREYPDAGPNLLRSLIVAHAQPPEPTMDLFSGSEDRLYKAVGYGMPDELATLYSLESKVTLLAEEAIRENEHHFYEIPLPQDFLSPPARRHRRITVALAHTPYVRRTRFDYCASRFSFRVIRRPSLEEVERVFRHTPRREREPNIPETGDFNPGATLRDKGTVQKASWDIQVLQRAHWEGNHLFVVVTRTVPAWAGGIVEEEPYALVIVIEDRSSQQVRYYTQIEQLLRIRLQV